MMNIQRQYIQYAVLHSLSKQAHADISADHSTAQRNLCNPCEVLRVQSALRGEDTSVQRRKIVGW